MASPVGANSFANLLKTSRINSLLRVVFLFISLTANADYQTGLDAYNDTNYPLAMQEWQAVTQAPPAETNPAIYAETHYAIAMLYWQGQGVPRDYNKAYEWLQKAAELNHAGAMGKLGYLYTDGIAVPQDYNQAFEWYARAAKLGDVDGQYNLGIFYLNGWGTAQDTTMARQYLAAASAQGDEAAEEAFQSLVGANSFAINNESWIQAQNPAHYTIQVIGLSSTAKVEALITGHEDLAPFATYTVQNNSKPIHVLIQGDYPTAEAARAARDAFPREISPPDRVWIRQFVKVQQLIQAEQ